MPASSKDTATIATLSVKLDGAISMITKLEGRFDIFQSNFIQKDLYNVKHEELVKQVTINTTEIYRLQKGRWIMPTITMVLGGVLVFLTNYAITH